MRNVFKNGPFKLRNIAIIEKRGKEKLANNCFKYCKCAKGMFHQYTCTIIAN